MLDAHPSYSRKGESVYYGVKMQSNWMSRNVICLHCGIYALSDTSPTSEKWKKLETAQSKIYCNHSLLLYILQDTANNIQLLLIQLLLNS